MLSVVAGGLVVITRGDAAAAAAPRSAIGVREVLRPGTQLTSPNGFVTLRMQTDGNLSIWAGSHPLWTARTHGAGNYLTVAASGRTSVVSKAGRALWTIDVRGLHNVLRIGDDGNLTVTAGTGKTIWSLGTRANSLFVNGTLRSGHRLTGGGGETLTMQTDGNLVLRRGASELFATGTNGHPGAFLSVQPGGNLVIRDARKVVLWQSGSRADSPVRRLFIDAGGNLLLATTSGTILWQTWTMRNPTAAAYAARLLGMWGGKVSGLPEAKSDLLATRANQTIKNTSSCGNAVRVDIRVVRFLVAVTARYKIKINNIISGHGCDSGQHPKGRSIDLGGAWDLRTGAATSFGGYWGANNLTMDRDFANYAASILPDHAGLGQSNCAGTSSARPRATIEFFADACNHQHIQVQRRID